MAIDQVNIFLRDLHQDAVAMQGSGRPTLLWHATNAGHWATTGGFSCTRNHHPGHQLMFILGGHGTGKYRGKRWAAGPGTCVAMDLGEPHHYASDPDDPWTLFWVIIDSRGPGLDAQMRALTGGRGPVVPYGSVRRVLAAADALFPLMRSGRSEDIGWIHHHLSTLMALLFEAQQQHLLHEGFDGDSDARSDGGDPQRGARTATRHGVTAALDLIRSDFMRTISLDELATAAGYTSSHFVRRFRAATGATPFDYLERYRIARAQELLHAGSTKPVADVGAEVGYEDPAYFSRVFRRVTGTTPSRYRLHRL